MADVKVCDRCRQEIDFSSSECVLDEESFELCYSCAGELMDWLHGEDDLVDDAESVEMV